MSFKSAFIIAANSCLFSSSFDFYFWSVCAMYKWCVCLLVLEPCIRVPVNYFVVNVGIIQISRVVPHIRMQTSTRAPTFNSWFQGLSLSSIICFIIFISLLKSSLTLPHLNPIHFFYHFFLLSLFLVFIFKNINRNTLVIFLNYILNIMTFVFTS